jgi:hypothetical protein
VDSKGEKRITAIGEISESAARMRLGFREGFNEIITLSEKTKDPEVLRFAQNTLNTIAQDYELRVGGDLKRSNVSALSALQMYIVTSERVPWNSPEMPINLAGIVKLINDNSNLEAIAGAFFAFREATGQNTKMFDFDGVAKWCSQNRPKCE